ncbi:hypothetical protein [Lysobacter capsici]|uniref:hypothetical protein n=1 Tax=Lysobacter capsici TaxID=435897 RepID=UPI001C004D69|nr:hypothetical protein [Lysobacter capsici]QWF18324.1 hypothetical protein KME82_06055 [Lysobacter capsici]
MAEDSGGGVRRDGAWLHAAISAIEADHNSAAANRSGRQRRIGILRADCPHHRLQPSTIQARAG